MKTSPKPHQAEDFEKCKDIEGWGHFWEMGVGKSFMAIAQAEYLFHKGEIDAILIIAPPSVHDMWVTEQLPEHMSIPWTGHVYHASKAKTKKAQQEWRRMMKEEFPVLVMTYQAFRTARGKNDGPDKWVGKDLAKRFLRERKCLYILDECFRKGTLVDTPTGPKAIETILPGDKVLGCNGISTVRNVHRNFIEEALRVVINGKSIDVSRTHPFFTTRGWVAAQDLEVGDECITQKEAVRMVRRESGESKMQILREVLLSEMENVSTRTPSKSIHQGKKRKIVQGSEGQGYAMDEEKKTSIIRRASTENFERQERENLSNRKRRKWKGTNRAAETTFTVAGRRLEARAYSVHKPKNCWLSFSLQNRYSTLQCNDSRRVGWTWTPQSRSTEKRQKEKRVFKTARVESIQDLELGRNGVPGEVFYDLEIGGHPSYSVEGILVHNSQRVKTPGTKITKSILYSSPLAKNKRILSGTSVTNSPFDVYSQIKFLDPTFWPRHGFGSYQSFKTTFGVFEEIKFQKTTPSGSREQSFQKLVYYRNLDYLCQILKEISDRHLTEEVLNLPERTFSRRYFDPSPEQKRLYKDLARDFYAFIEESGEMVTTQLAITRMVRFQQILSGFLERDIEEGGGRIFLKDNPRLNCLLDLLENDLEGKKVIVWARFKQDIDFITQALGEQAVRFDGKVSTDERYQNRKRFSHDPSCLYFVANPAAGGTGLTLNEAQDVVYYTNSFDLEQRLQSQARNYRIGQAGTVNVIDILARGLPFDSQLLSRLRSKAKMLAKVMGDEIKEWI